MCRVEAAPSAAPRGKEGCLEKVFWGLNHNFVLNLLVAGLTGLADSVWSGTIGVAFMYDVFGESNAKVGFATAVQGISQLATALPSGYAADVFKRSRVIATGGVSTLCSACLMTYAVLSASRAHRHGGHTHTAYILVCVAYAFFGFSNGIISGPAQALLADSVPTGQRSKYYNWLFLAYIIPTFVGPLIAVIWFAVRGDEWHVIALRDLILTGLAIEIPVGLLLFLFRDDKALDDESEAVNHQEEPLIVEEEKVHKMSGRVPYVVFATDMVVALGSGMTIKFFPLFFKNDCNMTPAQVQSIYIAVALAMASASTLGVKLGHQIGRVQAVLCLRCAGLTCFGGVVVLYNRGFADTRLKWLIVAVYVARTALMNCTYPLEESILMDYVPKATRARWKSLESISQFGWCGSALLGGVLSDRLGYTRTFLLTIALQATGTLIYSSLLGVVVRENVTSVTLPDDSDPLLGEEAGTAYVPPKVDDDASNSMTARRDAASTSEEEE